MSSTTSRVTVWVGLAALVLVVVATLGAANAAGLQLVASGSPVFATGAQRCDAGPLTVSPSGTPAGGPHTQVTVSGIDGPCATGGVAVLAGTAPHTVLFSGTGPVDGGAFTATSSAFAPTADAIALVSLDGWIVPATWAYTPPPPPPPADAISCRPVDPAVTATCSVHVGNWTFWGSGYRVDFSVTTTSPTPFEWEIQLDLSKQVAPPRLSLDLPLFPGYPVPAGGWWSSWTPTQFTHSNVCSVGTNADLPIVRLRGPFQWNRYVSASQPAVAMGFQANQSGGGPLGGSGVPAC